MEGSSRSSEIKSLPSTTSTSTPEKCSGEGGYWKSVPVDDNEGLIEKVYI